MNHDQTVKVQYFGIILSKIFEKECRRLLAGDMLHPSTNKKGLSSEKHDKSASTHRYRADLA